MKILGTRWELSRTDASSSPLASRLSAAEIELRHDLTVTRAIVVTGFLLGLCALAGLWISRVVIDGFTIFFWALACYALGSLAGFLFGIPRVLQGHATEIKSQPGSGSKTDEPVSAYQLLINTNLDDISDWLTKIVVGVGLVELREIPGLLNNLAILIAGEKGKSDVPFIIAVILYFTVIGFMSGYLTTRMFFQRAFRASDLAAGGIVDRQVVQQTITQTDQVSNAAA